MNLLVALLITALVFVGVYAIVRLAVRYMVKPGDIQDTVVLILGIVGLIFLLVEVTAILGGGQGRIASGFR